MQSGPQLEVQFQLGIETPIEKPKQTHNDEVSSSANDLQRAIEKIIRYSIQGLLSPHACIFIRT